MATAGAKKALSQRLWAAQGNVSMVEKDGFNKGLGKPYTSHDAYMEAARPILNEQGVIAVFNQLTCVVGKGSILVECELVLMSSDDKTDFISVKAYHLQPAMGKDKQTKEPYFTGKEMGAAYSYCAKYLIAKSLMMSSGEDLDDDGGEKPASKAPPKPKRPKAKAAPPKKATPKKAAKKRTPSPPPAEDEDDGEEYEAIIPEEAWDDVRELWHTRGTISEPQAKRLFAISRNEGGWEGDAMKAELEAGLGVGLDDLPWGDPYNAVVDIFTNYTPDGGTPDESGSNEDEGVDDDIPF